MYVSFGPNFYDRPDYQSGAAVRRELINMFPEGVQKFRQDRQFILLPVPGLGSSGITLSNSGTIVDVVDTQEGTFSDDLFVAYNDGATRYIERVNTSDAVTTLTGDALTNSGEVSIAFSTISGSGVDSQMVFTSDGNVYYHADSTSTYTDVTVDANLTFETVVYIDGRFVAIPTDDDVFYWTEVLDGDNWPSTNFATAEFAGDNLVTAVTRAAEIVLFGTDSIERWASTGDSELPFARIGGGVYEVGCVGPRAALNADGSIYFVSDESEMYRLEGAQLQKVSTAAITEILDDLTAVQKRGIKLWHYGQDGHEFIGLYLPGQNFNLVYDATVNEWHKRAQNASAYSTSIIRWDNKIISGDTSTATLYTVDKSQYNDGAGSTMERTCTIFVPTNSAMPCYNFIVDAAKGVGDGGANDDPSLDLSWSDDFNTFSNTRTLSLGSQNSFSTRIFTTRLGRMTPPGRIFKMTFSGVNLYRIDGVRINERDI